MRLYGAILADSLRFLCHAAAIPATKTVLPFPRATDSAAVPAPGANAPRTNRRCQGSTVNPSPARRPCVIVRPDR